MKIDSALDQRIDQLLGPDHRYDQRLLVATAASFQRRLLDLGFPIEAVHVDADGEVRLRFNQRQFERLLCRLEAEPSHESVQIHQNTSLF